MARRRKPKTIHVSGRRWFQRSYGNTYHSVTIYVDGDEVAYVPMTYGYDQHYLQTATEWLLDNGYLPGFDERRDILRLYCERKGIKFTYDVADVARERDL